MDYKKHYDLLISRSKKRNISEYTEKHHIVPLCLGGYDKKENIVELTPEEHYVAHQLLVKIYPNHRGLVWAALMMTGHSNSNKRNNNKLYGWLKRKNQKIAKGRLGNKNGSHGRSWYHCPETLENGKFLEKDIPSGWVKGRVPKKEKNVRRDYCHDPKTYRVLEVVDTIPSGWVKGKPNKKLRWYHNPKTLEEIQWYPDDVLEGWVLGKSKNRTCSIEKVCSNCETNFVAKCYKTKYCSYCRKRRINTFLIIDKKEEIIRDYEKFGSLNKALKENGFPGAVGGYYTQAKEIIDNHYKNHDNK